MRLVTYLADVEFSHLSGRLGVLADGGVVDVSEASGGTLPSTMIELLRLGRSGLAQVRGLDLSQTRPVGEARLLAALPDPASVRDFYAFEAHVRDARAARGLEMVPEWYDIPVFYFSNHTAIRHPDEPVSPPPGSNQLDFELEVAIVIGEGGIDIEPSAAFEHIAGLMVLNDWSARDLQVREMMVGLGPSKGKDFALGLGPWLCPIEDLGDRIEGETISLEMTARLNGEVFCRGNLSELHHSIPRLVAHASRGVPLRPGDVLGTGTVGGGCIFEAGPDATFLQPGDVVELEVERLGVLRNPIA